RKREERELARMQEAAKKKAGIIPAAPFQPLPTTKETAGTNGNSAPMSQTSSGGWSAISTAQESSSASNKPSEVKGGWTTVSSTVSATHNNGGWSSIPSSDNISSKRGWSTPTSAESSSMSVDELNVSTPQASSRTGGGWTSMSQETSTA